MINNTIRLIKHLFPENPGTNKLTEIDGFVHWVPVTTACRILALRIEEIKPDIEGKGKGHPKTGHEGPKWE